MLNMTAQVKSEYNQVAELSSAASPPEEPKKAVDSGGTSDTDGSALIGVATASSVAAHQSLEVEKKEKGDFHATEGTTGSTYTGLISTCIKAPRSTVNQPLLPWWPEFS